MYTTKETKEVGNFMRYSNKIRFNFYFDKDLRKEFKVACTEIDRSMSEVLNELINRFLIDHRAKKGGK